MKFSIPPDGNTTGALPGSSGLADPRRKEATMNVSSGPMAGGKGAQGVTGTTEGQGGSHITGFSGKPKGYSRGAFKEMPGASNPMKR
jgi:hypothetical protein